MADTITIQEYRDLAKKEQRRRKYGNTIVYRCRTCQASVPDTKPDQCPGCGQSDWERFDSLAEYNRWLELRILVRQKIITSLRRQTAWPMVVNGVRVTIYRSDFDYRQHGLLVVEDVKGGEATKTPSYRIKKRLMLALHGITITEVG